MTWKEILKAGCTAEKMGECSCNECAKKAQKPDFLDIDNDGNKDEPMAQAYKDSKKAAKCPHCEGNAPKSECICGRKHDHELKKGRGLIDPEKVRQRIMRFRQFGVLGKKLPKRVQGKIEYAKVEKADITALQFEDKEINVRGFIEWDGMQIKFEANQDLPKPLMGMKTLPTNLSKFDIDSIMPKRLEDNPYIRDYIGFELADYFNHHFRYMNSDDFPEKFFRTSGGLKSGKEDEDGEVRYDKRSKRNSFKDVLRN